MSSTVMTFTAEPYTEDDASLSWACVDQSLGTDQLEIVLSSSKLLFSLDKSRCFQL